MIGDLEKTTHEKRLDKPDFFSLNKRAERRCEQNLHRLLQKWVNTVCFLLSWWIGQETVSINYKGQSKRFEERRAETPKNTPKGVQFPSPEISVVLNDICKEGENDPTNSLLALSCMILWLTAWLIEYILRCPCTSLMALFVINWWNFIHLYMYKHMCVYMKILNLSVCNIWLNVISLSAGIDCNTLKYVVSSGAILPEEAQALWSVLSQHSDKICTWGICSKKVSAMYFAYGTQRVFYFG